MADVRDRIRALLPASPTARWFGVQDAAGLFKPAPRTSARAAALLAALASTRPRADRLTDTLLDYVDRR